MSTHTPGPWEVWFPDPHGFKHVIDQKNHIVCRVMSGPNASADSRLIAVAPKMLWILDILDGSRFLPMWQREIIADLVAKAKGESSD